jgi:hypothetical protein
MPNRKSIPHIGGADRVPDDRLGEQGQSVTTEPTRVVLVQCTSAKRDEEAAARVLYDESSYFRKQRTYAQTADRWFIQSAEHGLVDPDTRLEPYDTRPSDRDDVDAWAEGIAADLVDAVGTNAVVEVLGGKAYADPLTPALEARGVDVLEPLRGQRIGKRQSTLDTMATRSLGEFA